MTDFHYIAFAQEVIFGHLAVIRMDEALRHVGLKRLMLCTSESMATGEHASSMHKALEGQLRNEHYRAVSPVRARIAEIEQEMAASTGRIQEIEAMMADPSHYKDSRNVVAVNREYAALKENVAKLTAEWEGLVGEAERIEADYRRRWEELAG